MVIIVFFVLSDKGNYTFYLEYLRDRDVAGAIKHVLINNSIIPNPNFRNEKF